MNFTSIPILATALSILIAWALFSMLCSYLQEAIAQYFAERGKFLKKYLLKQLEDKDNEINWAEKLYQQGSVDLLIRSVNKPTNEISAALFAKSMIDVFVNAVPINSIHGYPGNTLAHFKEALTTVKPSAVVSLFQQALNDAELKSIKNGFVDQSKVYTELLKNIEEWYTQFEERVSLWYKKNTRQRLFILGLILGILVNVDSVQLFKFFNSDVTARNAMISFYEKENYPANDGVVKAVGAEQAKSQALVFSKKLDSAAKAAALPVGIEESVFYKGIPTTNFAMALFEKIAGLLITGFAVSFGAPFWFDALRKIYKVKK